MNNNSIKEVVIRIVSNYGVELLEDTARFNALLKDFSPTLEKERKLLLLVLKEGLVNQLLKLQKEKEEVQNYEIRKCIKKLVDKTWITEDAAQYATLIFSEVLNLYYEDIYTTSENFLKEGTKNLFLYKNDQNKISSLSEIEIQKLLNSYNGIGFKGISNNLNIFKLTIPDNIEEIGSKAFLNCINLHTISFPYNLRKIGDNAFEGCYSLKKIFLQNTKKYKVIDGLLVDIVNRKLIRSENIENQETIIIMNFIKTICKKTFERNKARIIFISSSVEKIMEDAFYKMENLEKIEVDKKNRNFISYDGVLYNRKEKILVRYPQSRKNSSYYIEDGIIEIGKKAFSFSENLTTITFGAYLKKIGERAFEYCMKIENIIVPENVTIIEEKAFQYCKNLKSIILPRNLLEIGDLAFYNCVSLEFITIPKNIKNIGNLAFAHCTKLKKVIMQENIIFIGDGAFLGINELEIIIKNNSYVEKYCCSHKIKYKKILN